MGGAGVSAANGVPREWLSHPQAANCTLTGLLEI